MWRPPEYPGEFPSLGWELVDFLQDVLVNPDGERRGQPWRFTDEQIAYIVWCYRISPDTGARAFRRSVLARPKGWGKSPLLAALCIGEAAGPVVFDGWDADGNPVARPRASPHVQLAAVSEDQTDNTYSLLYEMLTLGSVADHAPGLDAGITRTHLPHNGGRIEPVTASSGSREGQRVTFGVLDETHLWTPRNGGVKLASTVRRNVGKMAGVTVETTNAPRLGEQSVAEATLEAWRRGGRGAAGIHVDFRESADEVPDLRDEQRLRAALEQVYGDAKWIDLDRIIAEVHDPGTEEADARRFYLNQMRADADAAFDKQVWQSLAKPDYVVAAKATITLGFDGARYEDATALVATEIATGHQWPLGIWERPLDDESWEVPEAEVDRTMADAFDTWKVWRLYADPPYWESPVARWKGRYGEKVVIEWFTHRDRQMAAALRNYRQAMSSAELSHDGDSVMARHIANARRRNARTRDEDGRPMWVISKDRRGSPRKIDGAMAGCLSWEARQDAIASGITTRKPRGMVVYRR